MKLFLRLSSGRVKVKLRSRRVKRSGRASGKVRSRKAAR